MVLPFVKVTVPPNALSVPLTVVVPRLMRVVAVAVSVATVPDERVTGPPAVDSTELTEADSAPEHVRADEESNASVVNELSVVVPVTVNA